MLQTMTAANGTEVLVEVEEVFAAEGVGDRVTDTFEDMFRKARPVIDGIVSGLGDLNLDQVSVKFSIKITGEGKILFIASGKVEGGIELSLTWKPQSGSSARVIA